MLRTRRGLFDVLAGRNSTAGAAAMFAARGHEAYVAELQAQGRTARPPLPPGVNEIRISSNENPLGPGQKVLDSIVKKFPEAGRYPFNSSPADSQLVAAIAAHHQVKPENVVLGAGSQEILKSAVRAFTSPDRALVTALPTFENPTSTAKGLGHPVKEVPLDSAFRLDVDGMIAAAAGAGLVFFNNPNNPTATVHGAKTVTDFVQQVRKEAPDVAILIDEAYHEYVTDPSYQTAVPLALETPNVLVARTFSKAYGMAGMRIGYAIARPETIKELARYKMPYNISVFGVAAALAALGDPAHIEAEQKRNTEVLRFTQKVLEDLDGKCTASQGNFLFVDLKRPAKDFRDACAKHGVMVGRDFPPFEKTHSRISIGTMQEMTKAAEVFRTVLEPTTTAGR
ncbi:MAG: histidinol-phosphate aminotransferase family protein [Acidobacteriota bacterium]|nr:histidinol-phosphate aminotransferase family protein [Acidobacteriota bacterium]MDQ3418303.1 histidinol-phosphate aminotransferase family protein [Acidobacteriota bacterium]